MKIDYKSFALELKADDDPESGIIEGLASTFGNIDLGDDVVSKGAFKKTLQENKGIVPILADHNPTTQIGWNLTAKETDAGLQVRGELNMEDPIAKSRWGLVKKAMKIGAKMGLSIGYMTIKAEPDRERPSVRHLKELKLYEYSIVTFPMNTQAMITAAKSWADGLEREALIAGLHERAKSLGLTPEVVMEALRKFGAAEHGVVPPESDPQLLQSADRILSSLKL